MMLPPTTQRLLDLFSSASTPLLQPFPAEQGFGRASTENMLVPSESNRAIFDKTKGFRRWADASFLTELLPIAPPNARIALGSSIRPEHLGKVPAVKNGDGTWSGFAGQWSKDFHATLDDCKQWHHWGANVGLQTRCFPAIDIDVDDEKAAAAIEAAALELFGPAPVRFRAGSPRRPVALPHGARCAIQKAPAPVQASRRTARRRAARARAANRCQWHTQERRVARMAR
jgi:hypothetical protein